MGGGEGGKEGRVMEMKRKECRSTYHKVNLEMGLRIRSKRVDVPILLFVREVVLVLHQPIINARKPDEFEQATMVRPSVVSPIRPGSGLFHRARPEEVAVQAVAVLEFKDVRQDRVVQQILPNVGATPQPG
jgi:hypothetical protein